MPVNCRTCKHYQRMVETKHNSMIILKDRRCLACADYPLKRSYYEPINGTKGAGREKDIQTTTPGT